MQICANKDVHCGTNSGLLDTTSVNRDRRRNYSDSHGGVLSNQTKSTRWFCVTGNNLFRDTLLKILNVAQ